MIQTKTAAGPGVKRFEAALELKKSDSDHL